VGSPVVALQRVVGNRRTGLLLRRAAAQHRGLQRFVEEEHRQLGQEASGGEWTNINYGTDTNPLYLTFGETVMMGDWFASLQQIRDLERQGQNGRDEIAWTRWKALESSDPKLRGPEPQVADAIKKSVMDRFYTLAAGNVTHFSAGGTAQQEYLRYHRQALRLAFAAGRLGRGRDWDDALTTEAFGAHFLTDMFSAGHVRTPRAEARAWYTQHFGGIDALVQYMARHMHDFIVLQHPIATAMLGRMVIPTVDDLAQTIKKLGGPAVAAFTLGDIVSLAMHDVDNRGLDLVSNVDATGTRVDGGYHWHGIGDSYLILGNRQVSDTVRHASALTRQMAVAALRASIAELHDAEAAGRAMGPPPKGDLVADLVRAGDTIEKLSATRALEYVPRADPAGTNVNFAWQWGSFNTPMRRAVDQVVKGTIADTLRDKGSTLTGDERDAVLDLAEHLRRAGIQALEAAVSAPAGARPKGEPELADRPPPDVPMSVGPGL
jgi:hypothetical protein